MIQESKQTKDVGAGGGRRRQWTSVALSGWLGPKKVSDKLQEVQANRPQTGVQNRSIRNTVVGHLNVVRL